MGDAFNAIPLPRRADLGGVGDGRRVLALPRDARAWLRHQHEVSFDLASDPIRIPIGADLHPVRICAPGGVPFQLNASASDDTYIAETAIVEGGETARQLKAMHPPSLGARMQGVAKHLSPAKARTLKLSLKAIRRNVFDKVSRMRDDTRVSVIKVDMSDFGQEKAAALDVWRVMDISDMDQAELSYPFEDGIESMADTIGFSGGIHPKETGFFKFEHNPLNEIAYSPVHDRLRFVSAVRWYDNKGDWRAGVPEQPKDTALQYSLVHDKWVTEDELDSETLGDRKRKFAFFLDTLYK